MDNTLENKRKQAFDLIKFKIVPFYYSKMEHHKNIIAIYNEQQLMGKENIPTIDEAKSLSIKMLKLERDMAILCRIAQLADEQFENMNYEKADELIQRFFVTRQITITDWADTEEEIANFCDKLGA